MPAKNKRKPRVSTSKQSAEQASTELVRRRKEKARALGKVKAGRQYYEDYSYTSKTPKKPKSKRKPG